MAADVVRSKRTRFKRVIGEDQHGLPPEDWEKLVTYAGGNPNRTLALISDVRAVADRWVGTVSAPNVEPGVDSKGIEALEALSRAFAALSISRSHDAMAPILRHISPHWDGRERFYLSQGEEHDAVWPAEVTFEISEFLLKKAAERPKLDEPATAEATDQLVALWGKHLRMSVTTTEKKKRGSTRAFYELLLPHIVPKARPNTAPPHRRHRGRNTNHDVAVPADVRIEHSFAAACLEGLLRAIKRKQSNERTPRPPRAAKLPRS